MSLWDTLTPPWRVCMEEAWAGFCAGSWPAGAVVVDGATGRMAARAHNLNTDRTGAHPLSGSDVAHAEILALGQIRNRPLRHWVLYCSLEPCPMCIGAVRMAHIRELRYAAKDAFAGAAGFLAATPFMSSFPVKVGRASPALQDAILALAVVRAIGFTKGGRWRKNVAWFGKPSPAALEIGQAFAAEGVFERLRDKQAPVRSVLEAIEERRRGARAQ